MAALGFPTVFRLVGDSREIIGSVLRLLYCPVLHVAVDVGVELTASEDAIEAGGLGSG